MQVTVGASAMTLGGLLKHMARAEDHWFSVYLTGATPGPPWNAAESEGNGGWDGVDGSGSPGFEVKLIMG